MDTLTIVVGVCFFLLITTLIVWSKHQSKQKEHKLRSKFDKLIEINNLKLTHWEDLGGKLIGIAAVNKMLVFVSPKVPDGVAIGLDNRNAFDILRDKKKSQLHLRKAPDDGRDSGVSLPFFDPDTDDLLRFDYLSQKADQWLTLIRQTK